MTATKRTYKALFLFLVFSMNTVVSFACLFSDVFHNFHHHNRITATKEHDHSGDHHAQAHKHHGDKPAHSHDTAPSGKSKDDCCSDSIVAIEKADKSLSRAIGAPQVHSVLSSFYPDHSTLYFKEKTNRLILPVQDRWRYPATIQDLRIVIQSFQI